MSSNEFIKKIKIPAVGTRWTSTENKKFRVLATVEQENKIWVHYISEDTNQEYSCYLESFLDRFVELLS
jgi:hypothetical protein